MPLEMTPFLCYKVPVTCKSDLHRGRFPKENCSSQKSQQYGEVFNFCMLSQGARLMLLILDSQFMQNIHMENSCLRLTNIYYSL